MSLISFSPIQDGVTGVNAAATNTPLSTIYNDYNGNITDANIASNAAITQSKIALSVLNAQKAYIATAETTTSASYVDLATPGPSVTVTIGASGLAIVIFGAEMFSNTGGDYADMTIVVSGANTIAAGTAPYRLFTQGTTDNKIAYSTLITGLTTGSTTFKCQYRIIVGGTATFQYRELSVIPL